MGDWLLTGILEVFLQGSLRMRVGRERRTIGGGHFLLGSAAPSSGFNLDSRHYGMQHQYPIPWRRSGASGLGDAGVGSLRF